MHTHNRWMVEAFGREGQRFETWSFWAFISADAKFSELRKQYTYVRLTDDGHLVKDAPETPNPHNTGGV